MKPQEDRLSKTPSRARKFMRDLGVYAIGNIGSKLVTFLLVPFYTYYITNPADYGYYDLCLTTMFCIIPIVGMLLQEGAFRFLIDTDDFNEQRKVVSYVLTTVGRNAIFVLVVGLLVWLCFDIKYMLLTMAFGLVQTIYEVELQIVRGLGKTKLFVSAGIVNSLLIGGLSVLFVMLFDMGVPGIFWANILSRLAIVCMLDWRAGILQRYFSVKALDKKFGREILHYSLPLIPSGLCFWFLTANNYYFLEHYCGMTEIGLYGIMSRFSSILFVLVYIFYQTWQQNAIEQYNTPDRDRFFSSVFNNYVYLLCGMAILFSFGVRLNYGWLVSEQYRPSAIYLFINSIYVMAYSLSAFFELGYQCTKNTRRIVPPLFMALGIILVSNYILVPRFAIWGVVYSSLIAWSFILVYRAIDTRKYMKINISKLNLLLLCFMVVAGVIYYNSTSVAVDIIFCCIFAIIYFALAPREILNKFKKLVGR